MLKRLLSGIGLVGIVSLITVLPALAHDGGDSVEFSLTGRMTLGIASVAAVLAVGTVQTLNLKLSKLQLSIIGLTIITAVVHLLAGLSNFILILNGLGYLTILAALYIIPVNSIRKMQVPLYWGLIGYTLLTIVLYFVSHPWGYEGDALDRLGLVTKAVEVVLAGLVLVDWFQHRRASNPMLPIQTSTQPSES